jgi:membrane fusion protein (multidrug efflux system)
VTITTQVSGKIVDAPVRENDTVKAGDVLFKIDDQPYKIALAAAEAGLSSARLQVEELRAGENAALAAVKAASDDVDFYQKNFDRIQGLLAKGVASQAQYDQSEQSLPRRSRRSPKPRSMKSPRCPPSVAMPRSRRTTIRWSRPRWPSAIRRRSISPTRP